MIVSEQEDLKISLFAINTYSDGNFLIGCSKRDRPVTGALCDNKDNGSFSLAGNGGRFFNGPPVCGQFRIRALRSFGAAETWVDEMSRIAHII